jgi:hypothetical protein
LKAKGKGKKDTSGFVVWLASCLLDKG